MLNACGEIPTKPIPAESNRTHLDLTIMWTATPDADYWKAHPKKTKDHEIAAWANITNSKYSLIHATKPKYVNDYYRMCLIGHEIIHITDDKPRENYSYHDDDLRNVCAVYLPLNLRYFDMEKQYRLLMPQVTLDMSFEDILGLSSAEITEPERKQRWVEWLEIAAKEEYRMDELWSDTTECIGCKHLNEIWCDLAGLPCTVNPILSFQHALIGMACMGAGREPISGENHG